MNRTDTHHLFTSQPKYRDEASRSWWRDMPYGKQTETAESHLPRMSRSKEAKGVSITFIIGHAGRAK